MQATNQKCNAFQTLVGVFLQACAVPDAARKLLAHIGVSISVSAIETAVKNLSKEAYAEMRRLGQSFETSYAYDNLDIDIKPGTPTWEATAKDTLSHLTTASMFPLNHGIRAEDLQYSDFMWNLMKDPPLAATTAELFKAVPSQPSDNKGLLLDEFFKQAGIRDDLEPDHTPSEPSSPSTTVGSVGNYVVPVFGDLLTVQHLRSLQLSRLNNVSPWQWFQFVVCGHGWFHVRMACVQTIWRRPIDAKGAKIESTSLIAYVAQLRPQERPKIENDPSFRQMHEVITHIGIVMRRNAWKSHVKLKHEGISSLNEWAAMEPTWIEICEMSEEMLRIFVAPVDFRKQQKKPDCERDKQFEVTQMIHKDFLLYEETNHAMNFGDIGRLDQCMLVWMHLFMGCGKVKYGVEIRQYLENMYIQYPKPVAQAMRLNMLSNPTGRKGHFRGIDWEIELLNMYIKRYHGGKDSNHTIDRMIELSPLIEIFKDVRAQFEQMFCLEHKTSRHSPAKMSLTFAKVERHMEKHHTNEFIPGRGSEYEITDMASIGMTKLIVAIDKAREKQKRDTEHLDALEKTTTAREQGTGIEEDAVEEPEEDDNVDFGIEDDGSLFV
ncbi:hypothetical protein AGABI2DRAFT_73074 [Agaricus bisporus var. bisporus H97]|uniref:hypothetical protein n=1 Tax=Agaricus bisporus var. bisporus (strain H97 / ATCC MYA-4626 / FGSC 10389) TaxID=936046 RepID=UPI00029F6C79|nr:hypothetical protein AGABI2DRAFT_73074 [Agaricus bisporus var. bisporus H97]EKV46038.1 hypothetical protein AGABI2DRAFT_73074 [Agaricus bisporus var. bisporus H97]